MLNYDYDGIKNPKLEVLRPFKASKVSLNSSHTHEDDNHTFIGKD